MSNRTKNAAKSKPVDPPADPPRLRLEWVEAGSLTANPRNWRRHPEHQVAALKGMLNDPEVGWAGALLFNERTGRLVDGHARQKVVDPKAPVPVLIGNWSEAAEQRILLTLDPIANMAIADIAQLESLLKDVSIEDEWFAGLRDQLDLIVTSTEKFLAAEDQAGDIVEDEVPLPPDEAVTQPGDIWILGNHRLMCGDSASPADVDRLLDGATIQLVNTDPPYNVKVEPRSNNAIAAGLSSFQATHHQGFDVEPKFAGASMTRFFTGAAAGLNVRLSQSRMTKPPVEWTIASTEPVWRGKPWSDQARSRAATRSSNVTKSLIDT